ncbi:hypothetical protein Pint_15945 [Pistacia integerrima]|uniref:Uncharacterized protein n=1 Tax=Pistacia integerrima TaxID=434235 RepID=A0ACC0ZFU8_9ROSI|nr:hypothetical protein Pint_15945 [Pistacia integerrima]
MAVLNRSIFITIAVLAVVIIGLAEAQDQSCASKLVACYKFINTTTKPDNDCCSNIRNAVQNELKCLCTLYTTPGLLQSFNVTVAQALKLTNECNVPTDINACKSSAASPTSGPGTVPGGDSGDGERVAWTGVTSLLLFCASMWLY